MIESLKIVDAIITSMQSKLKAMNTIKECYKYKINMQGKVSTFKHLCFVSEVLLK